MRSELEFVLLEAINPWYSFLSLLSKAYIVLNTPSTILDISDSKHLSNSVEHLFTSADRKSLLASVKHAIHQKTADLPAEE